MHYNIIKRIRYMQNSLALSIVQSSISVNSTCTNRITKDLSHITDVHIMHMDTDSFVLYSRSPNFIEEMKTMKQEYLDCANLPANHPLNYEPNNANVLGKFKDETAGVAIES